MQEMVDPHCPWPSCPPARIAESAEATGMAQNKSAAQTGGRIARQARKPVGKPDSQIVMTGPISCHRLHPRLKVRNNP